MKLSDLLLHLEKAFPKQGEIDGLQFPGKDKVKKISLALDCSENTIIHASGDFLFVHHGLFHKETGKVDAAAAYEQSRKREFVYEGYSDTTCEIELDEAPPKYINKEALRIALEISLLFNAEPLAKTQVMRKTVVDGSNTSGFQRTVMIARNGYVTVKDKKIKIYSICLEEDSARIIKHEPGPI